MQIIYLQICTYAENVIVYLYRFLIQSRILTPLQVYHDNYYRQSHHHLYITLRPP